jgi:hypothetical protein
MIGLIKPNEFNLKHTYGRIEEELMITIRRAIIQLMQERLKFGNKRDFRISIMPDSSLESAAKAVWYTFKVPEAVWCKSLIISPTRRFVADSGFTILDTDGTWFWY